MAAAVAEGDEPPPKTTVASTPLIFAIDASGDASGAAAAAAACAAASTPSWREPRLGHDDCYSRCLRKSYFPFLVAHSGSVLVAWCCILVISAIFGLGIVGLGFLNSTRSDLDLPAGTPSGDAVIAFEGLYPSVSSWAPAIIVIHNSGSGSVLSAATANISAAFDHFATQYPTVVAYVSGYYELAARPGLMLLAEQSVSPDNTTMTLSIGFLQSTNLDAINAFIDALLVFAASQSTGSVSVAATGLFPLFRQMSLATEADFSLIDGVVIPLAMIILGVRVQSYRHIGIALINLIIALLMSFAILVPIGAPGKLNINPFAPSIMLSLGVAVCFDYSLFLVTRFREERLLRFKSKEEAVYETLLTAGHVVLLSGGTLTATFVILLFFANNFLQSVGVSCSVTTAASVVVNLSMTPALLLYFDCMSFFDLCPTSPRTNCCCRVPHEDPADVARAAEKASIAAVEASGEAVKALRAREQVAMHARGLGVARARNSLCFSLPWIVSSFVGRIGTLAFVLLLTIPFLVAVLQLVPTSDDYLIYLQGSSTLNALTQMKQSFSEGSLDPYDVVLSTGLPGEVMTASYFAAENKVVHEILASNPSFVDPASFTALSYYNGRDVSFATGVGGYMNASSPLYSALDAAGYRALNSGKISADMSASLITIETTVNPDGQDIVPFINSVRATLTSFASPPSSAGLGALRLYLFGGYTTTLDVQNLLYALVPIDIAVVVLLVLATVAFSFRSAGLAARLVVTLALSLCWTFGMTVLVYQPGPAQNAFAQLTPSILASSGCYWIIPIMSFSILVGLALDYDVFLLSRTLEFREKGWSDRASVCLAVEKTGGIITTAGLIMSVSFMGLLIPRTVVLNQYGFTLFIGVAFDTFVMRPIIVPALIAALAAVPGTRGRLNWWPRVVPDVLLSEEDEDFALAAGLWAPQELAELRATLARGDVAVATAKGDGTGKADSACLPEPL